MWHICSLQCLQLFHLCVQNAHNTRGGMWMCVEGMLPELYIVH